MMSKIRTNKTVWEKEKLLVTSNFSFSHNVFKICLVLMCQNEYLWSKGLNITGINLTVYLNSFTRQSLALMAPTKMAFEKKIWE